MPDSLLIELLTEELPPKALKELSDVFASKVFFELNKDRFLEEGAAASAFATPRRLGILISKVKERSADSEKDVQAAAARFSRRYIFHEYASTMSTSTGKRETAQTWIGPVILQSASMASTYFSGLEFSQCPGRP